MKFNLFTSAKRTGCSLILAGLSLAISSHSWASCSYTITSNWGSGFTGEIRVTNNTNQTVNNWSVNWKDSATITSSWNANLTGSNPYTATSMGWNGTLAPNASASFGFQGEGNASVAVVNGSLCGSVTSSSSSIPSSSSSVSSISSVSSSSSSSVSSSSSSIGSGELILQENQLGFCGVDGTVDSNNSGYTGSGFANTDNASGTTITWRVNVQYASSYQLDWRYASTSTRGATVRVNGASAGNVDFPTTGAWTSWTTDSRNVNLNSGINEIVLAANTNEGLANIDSLSIVGNDISAASCGGNSSSSSVSSSSSSMSTSSSSSSGGTPGYIKISDKAPGWASVSGGTTGGGTDLSKAVTVSNMSDLKSAASGNDSKIILVTPGTYDGTLQPGANKTIIGTKPGVIISGNIMISGSDKKNIIIRNIAVRGKKCGSNDDCRSGSDGVYIGNGAHHIWFDHVDVADGQDGNFDVTRSGDFVTCSWCKFHYTYDKEHSLSNLIAGSDSETESRGKLNITYMFSMWGDRVNSRQPRGRFGKIHMLNNYHKNSGSLHGVGKEMTLLAEGCTYDVPGKDVFFSMGSPTGWKGIGNEGSAKGLNVSSGSIFTPPYSYSVMPASQAKAAILSSNCGVGNTCQLQQ